MKQMKEGRYTKPGLTMYQKNEPHSNREGVCLDLEHSEKDASEKTVETVGEPSKQTICNRSRQFVR